MAVTLMCHTFWIKSSDGKRCFRIRTNSSSIFRGHSEHIVEFTVKSGYTIRCVEDSLPFICSNPFERIGDFVFHYVGSDVVSAVRRRRQPGEFTRPAGDVCNLRRSWRSRFVPRILGYNRGRRRARFAQTDPVLRKHTVLVGLSVHQPRDLVSRARDWCCGEAQPAGAREKPLLDMKATHWQTSIADWWRPRQHARVVVDVAYM